MPIRISKTRVALQNIPINLSRATVASHATTADIWGSGGGGGNQIDWTGTATTTAFPVAPGAGAERVLICAGASSFTAGTNMLIDGVASGSTVTCAANDQVIVRSVSTTQFKLSRIKYDGTAQVAGGFLLAVGIADQTYSGIVEAGTAAAALAFGELCYFVTASSQWNKAQANAASTSSNKLGICVLAAAGAASATTMLLYGKVRAVSLSPAMTIGAPVYASAATAGVITSTAPTGTTDFVVRKVGFANSADELFFNPSDEYITLV